MTHQECDGIAGHIAPEALEHTFIEVDGRAGVRVFMEGAADLLVAALVGVVVHPVLIENAFEGDHSHLSHSSRVVVT